MIIGSVRCLNWRISRGWVWSNVEELDLYQDNVSPIIRLNQHGLARKIREQLQDSKCI